MSEDNHSHHFIVPLRYYIGTFIALLFLTWVTVWIAQIEFGDLNIYVAMAVAGLKATLVASFFMGLKWEVGFNRVFFISSLLVLVIFILFTLSDVLTRGAVDKLEEGVHGIDSPVKTISTSPVHH